MHFEIDGHKEAALSHKNFSYATNHPLFAMHDTNGIGEINFPESTEGKFLSHSFTKMNAFLMLSPSSNSDTATFNIKYAVRKFPYIGKNNRYITYQLKLNLSKFKKEMKLKK